MEEKTIINKIYSAKKRAEILAILKDANPAHSKRLWLIGFLKYTGYSEDGIATIIKQLNNWTDYDETVTHYQIKSVFKNCRRSAVPSSLPNPAQIGLNPVKLTGSPASCTKHPQIQVQKEVK